MVEILVAALGVAALVIVAVVLWRQPHPDDSIDHVDRREPGGPTQERYPPGSNPAGPGAESQDPDSTSRGV